MSNERQSIARCEQKYEFYTRREDIENELSHYEDHFRNKVVYCNCDDPVDSEFWRFFQRNFRAWGLKKLIATHYEPNEKNYSYMLTLGEGSGWTDEPEKTLLPCNGDFRSQACIELLKQADIVVTNPPFSLFREYVAQLMEYGKKFLIIGNSNAISYKTVFPLLMDNKIWLGYTSPKKFLQPDGTYKTFGNITWFTNLDIPKRHERIDLRGNYYSPEGNPKFDNFDAIEVSKVNDIPCDYDGVMAVPIGFMSRYNPEQFEIVNALNRYILIGNEDVNEDIRKRHSHACNINGEAKYFRVLIRRKVG